MVTPISAIPNLGPATEAAFAKAGILSAEDLRALGADAAYLKWLEAGLPPHFIGYYVLVMGLQGRPWNDCTAEEKRALRRSFDALKARAAASGTPSGLPRAIADFLNQFGLRDPPPR